MAFRTPLLQPRSQYHSYWGQYAYAVGAGVWANGSNLLPGAPGNPLSATEFAKIEVGDIASTTDALLIANRGLFVCVATPTAATVEWRRLDNGVTVTQTIRDAHVIVVGQTGASAPLPAIAAIAIPPLATNGLNLAGVGEVLSVTVDYLDPGDGTELTLALAAAAAAGIAIDIRLRPCDITLTAATAPLVVPPDIRLIGAGHRSSLITGRDSASQTVITTGKRVSLEDMTIVSPAPTAATTVGTAAVIEGDDDLQVLRCDVYLIAATAFDREQTAGIRVETPTGKELIDDCNLFIDSLAGQTTTPTAKSVAVVFGSSAAGVTTNGSDMEVRNTYIDEASLGVGSCPIGVEFVNVSGGRAFNVEHVQCRAPSGAFIWGWAFTLGTPPTDIVRGPKFIECRVTTLADETTALGNQVGFFIFMVGTPNIGAVLDGMIHDCVVQYLFGGNPNPAIRRTGFQLSNASTDTAFRFFTYDNCKSIFSNVGFEVDATGAAAEDIESVKFTACQAPAQINGNLIAPHGMRLRGLPASLNVKRVGVQNCDFADQPAGFGILVADAGVTDAILLGNSLTPAGGTALSDLGTGTEAAHNIL
jgi:hypothetical protein